MRIPNNKKTLEEVLDGFHKVHGDKYDYSLITKDNYIDTHHNVQIICKECGRIFPQTPHAHTSGQGCYSCGVKKAAALRADKPNKSVRSKAFGVGVFDVDYSCRKDKKVLPVYRLWYDMLRRCYDAKYHTYKNTYNGCCVCEEWKIFSNFEKWFNDPINGYKDGYQLDKDILEKNNKIYSPNTCCFVPQFINTLLLNGSAKRNGKNGNVPIGVTYYGNRYYARMSCYGKVIRIGTFNNEEDAFCAYKNAREAYIKNVAQKYYDEGKITKRVYDALMNYKIEIND